MLNRFGVKDVDDALVERDASPEREQEDGDDKTPEVDFPAISQGMLEVRSRRCPMQSVEKQKAVSGVDDRMDTLAQQG